MNIFKWGEVGKMLIRCSLTSFVWWGAINIWFLSGDFNLTDPAENPNGSVQVQLDWKTQYQPPESFPTQEVETEENNIKDGSENSSAEEVPTFLPQVALQDTLGSRTLPIL
jgi:hypothetical protein